MKKREEPDTMTAIQTRLKDKRWLIPMTLAILAIVVHRRHSECATVRARPTIFPRLCIRHLSRFS